MNILQKNLPKLKGFNAFTLAEVLIVIGIIGIIAELTIPTLLNSVQDAEFKSKMKKEYSVVAQAYQLVANDNGGTFSGSLSSCTGPNDHKCLKNAFKDKLSYIKDCDSNDGANLGVCFPEQANIKLLNGSAANANYLTNNLNAGLVLKDGASFGFFLDNPDCTGTRGNAGYTNACGFIVADINGLKKPNTWGRDIYLCFIFADRTRPGSVQTIESGVTTVDDCGVGSNKGYTCTGKYLSGN